MKRFRAGRNLSRGEFVSVRFREPASSGSRPNIRRRRDEVGAHDRVKVSYEGPLNPEFPRSFRWRNAFGALPGDPPVPRDAYLTVNTGPASRTRPLIYGTSGLAASARRSASQPHFRFGNLALAVPARSGFMIFRPV